MLVFYVDDLESKRVGYSEMDMGLKRQNVLEELGVDWEGKLNFCYASKGFYKNKQIVDKLDSDAIIVTNCVWLLNKADVEYGKKCELYFYVNDGKETKFRPATHFYETLRQENNLEKMFLVGYFDSSELLEKYK